jgi:hypothetical protein
VKKSTFKIIAFVILPTIILLAIGIYFLFQLPQVRYGLHKTLLNQMIERSIHQGKLSQEHGIQLKAAFDRFFNIVLKLRKSGIDQQAIENEIGQLVLEKQIGPNFSIPDDDKVEELIDFFNELSERLDELARQAESDSP